MCLVWSSSKIEESEAWIFIDYSTMSTSYKLYSLKIKKVIINWDIIFDKKTYWNWQHENVGQR